MLTTVLDRIEWNNKPPPHPKDEVAIKPKRAIVPSLELIGRGDGRGWVGGLGGKTFSVLDCSLVELYR